VDVQGLKINIDGRDIISLEVVAYKLKNEASYDDSASYDIDCQINQLSYMNEYDMLDASVTKVLIEINYTLKASTDSKSFTLAVKCASEQNYVITKDDVILSDSENDIYTCPLSYVVGFQFSGVTKSGDTVTATSADYSDNAFAKSDSAKNKYVIGSSQLVISNAITNDVAQTSGTVYILMDYSELNISNLYALLLEKGNVNLQTQLAFNDDIEFIIQEN
jgi:hypothetical protein